MRRPCTASLAPTARSPSPTSPRRRKSSGLRCQRQCQRRQHGRWHLPFELRQIASKYPVVLYTGPTARRATAAVPCSAAAAFHLVNAPSPPRKTRISCAASLATPACPYLAIGGQRIRGFSDLEWNQYLDAASYPKTSQLPASHKRPDPAPLVALQKPAAPHQHQGRRQGRYRHTCTATAPSAPNPNNPRHYVPEVKPRTARSEPQNGQGLHAAGGSSRHTWALEGEHAHGHYARPLTDLRLEGQGSVIFRPVTSTMY